MPRTPTCMHAAARRDAARRMPCMRMPTTGDVARRALFEVDGYRVSDRAEPPSLGCVITEQPATTTLTEHRAHGSESPAAATVFSFSRRQRSARCNARTGYGEHRCATARSMGRSRRSAAAACGGGDHHPPPHAGDEAGALRATSTPRGDGRGGRRPRSGRDAGPHEGGGQCGHVAAAGGVPCPPH